MIARNENALICDFAETYHIYDWRELPVKRAAIYAAGLPDDSRIKRELAGVKLKTDALLLAQIADALNILVWFKTEDGHRNVNRPKSILQSLMEDDTQKYMEFDSIEEYEAARKRIMES